MAPALTQGNRQSDRAIVMSPTDYRHWEITWATERQQQTGYMSLAFSGLQGCAMCRQLLFLSCCCYCWAMSLLLFQLLCCVFVSHVITIMCNLCLCPGTVRKKYITKSGNVLEIRRKVEALRQVLFLIFDG